MEENKEKSDHEIICAGNNMHIIARTLATGIGHWSEMWLFSLHSFWHNFVLNVDEDYWPQIRIRGRCIHERHTILASFKFKNISKSVTTPSSLLDDSFLRLVFGRSCAIVYIVSAVRMGLRCRCSYMQNHGFHIVQCSMAIECACMRCSKFTWYCLHIENQFKLSEKNQVLGKSDTEISWAMQYEKHVIMD